MENRLSIFVIIVTGIGLALCWSLAARSQALSYSKGPIEQGSPQSANVPQEIPVIQVLQIYPNGHNTVVVAQAIAQWSDKFHIDVLPVTAFNSCTSVECVVAVSDPLTGETFSHPIDFYDVLFFGIADNYGNYDLSGSSAQVVREFAKLQRGLVFTHDTVANWVNSGNNNPHPNFASLVDVHGLGLTACPYLLFTNVKSVITETASPILNSPFKIPASFETLTAHWGGQTVISGTAWYNGTDPTLSEDYQLYMQTYTNPKYGSHSSFYSFGHTEAVPKEWEAKAMINSMYFSYRGSGPTLEFPVNYDGDTFAEVALGHVTDESSGRINSWFDHTSPDYTTNANLTRWDGQVFTFTEITPTRGISWYDGHNGIDIKNTEEQEIIYAAAQGIVTNTVITCTEGITTCGGYFGNQVWIDHGLGYASLYGHLDAVSVTVGTKITDVLNQPLGTMGNTGNSFGTHLHFSVYLDQDKDGWSYNDVVDPYGWFGLTDDPWDLPDLYLWKYPLWTQQPIDSSGGSLTSPSGHTTIVFPSDLLTSSLTVELWDTTPVAGASASLRTTGHSFWVRVLEWLSGSEQGQAKVVASSSQFTRPYTITVAYDPNELRHLDSGQLGVYRYEDIPGQWIPIKTTIDQEQFLVNAFSNEVGNFDLQAPLLCPADNYEPDDSFYSAVAIPANGQKVSRLFDITEDEDWFQVELQAGKQYSMNTTDLSTGVGTVLELYDLDGLTQLASGERLAWTPSLTGMYFIKVTRTPGSASGCDALYSFSVSENQKVFLPMLVRKQ